MRCRRAPGAALALLVLLAARPAAADDAADILFWTSIRASKNPAEFAAYLKAFPHGKFAGLARIRAGTAAPGPAASDGAASREPAVPAASLAVGQPVVRAIDRIAVDLDARGLARASNHRLVVVPAGTPDALDADTLAALGTSVGPERLRLTLPPAPPGSDEVRLYVIPPSARAFQIAARAPVEVTPGAPGATVVAALAREAAALGAVGFEAKYRDVPLKVTGQFLRAESRTATPDIFAVLRGESGAATRYVVLTIGHLGTPTMGEGPAEIACVLPAEDAATLSAVAKLQPGDALVLDGKGSTWGAGAGSEFVVLDPCRLAS